MSHRPPVEGRPATAPFVLEVKRFKEGESAYVRTLSEKLDGLAYHWWKGRGEFCSPKGCPGEIHKQKLCWKGYFAGEIYEERTKLWRPWAIEVTQALELDFRRVYERGQVWFIELLKPTKKSSPPLTGRLIERLDPASVPPPFDFLPTLCSMYNAEVQLGVKNWLPDRVIIAPSTGPAPKPIQADHDKHRPVTDAQWGQFRDALKGAFSVPAEDTRNGRKH